MNLLITPSLFLLPLAGIMASLHDNEDNLYIIFGFVLCLLAIIMFFKYQRDKMWHETARIALEKGQPVPSRWNVSFGSGRGRMNGFEPWGYWSPQREIRRGLVLLAVSAGLYYSMGERTRGWIAIPACLGAVYLLLGLFSLLRGEPKDPNDHRDPPAQQ